MGGWNPKATIKINVIFDIVAIKNGKYVQRLICPSAYIKEIWPTVINRKL